MVCLGPRKKEKKSNLLSPDDATSRGLKKGSSKLKTSKTNASLAPSIASAAKKSPRSSLDTNNKKSTLPRPPSRNSLLSNGRTPSPVQRTTSPKPPPSSRPNSMISVKSAASAVSTNNTRPTSRTPSHASTTKRFPITEMKEEVKDLKAKVRLFWAEYIC